MSRNTRAEGRSAVSHYPIGAGLRPPRQQRHSKQREGTGVSTTTALDLGGLIAERGTKIHFSGGDPLFREGDKSTSVYACTYGRIKVFVTTPSGRDLLLGVKTPVQAFGELSAIDGRPRSASAFAMERSVVAQLTAEELLDAFTTTPMLALLVLREISDQLRRANARIAARGTQSTTARAGSLLLELGEKFRRHGPSVDSIELPITQDELAAWIGATREATARSLATFRKAGAISTGRNKIVLHGLDSLTSLTAACS